MGLHGKRTLSEVSNGLRKRWHLAAQFLMPVETRRKAEYESNIRDEASDQRRRIPLRIRCAVRSMTLS